jgi:hypothetical protein
MAILSVDQMWSRSASDATYSDKFRKLDIGFVEAYQVLHSPNEPKVNIYQANGIPAAGSFYPNFPFVVAEAAQIETVSPILSIVTINWKGEIGPGGPNAEPSPIFAPPKIDWDDVETEEEVDEDYTGAPIVTKNFEPIEGLKRPVADQTVTIRRNFLQFNPYVQAIYRQSVNSDSFLGWPPGTARMTKFSASNVLAGQTRYWEVTATIQFRYPYKTTALRAWWKRVLHQGLYERVDSGGSFRIVRAVDEDRKPVNKPVMLDQNGYRVPNGGAPYYIEFKVFGEAPYNALGLI